MVYYVCKLIAIENAEPSSLRLEIVDCKVKTLSPYITNKAFSKRELAEEFIKRLDKDAGIHVVVYEPK